MRLISWRRSFVELVAMLCIAGLCGAAGHSNRGFAEPQGGGRKAEFSPGGGCRGMAKGAKTPWLRSLPTFCRITESRSPRGSSGGEEKVIFSPRGLGPDGVWEAKLADPLFCPQARLACPAVPSPYSWRQRN